MGNAVYNDKVVFK